MVKAEEILLGNVKEEFKQCILLTVRKQLRQTNCASVPNGMLI